MHGICTYLHGIHAALCSSQLVTPAGAPNPSDSRPGGGARRGRMDEGAGAGE